MTDEEISSRIKEYLITELYRGAKEALTNDLPLISSGLIDSISTLTVVEFLETSFNFEFEPHEVDHTNLDTIGSMVAFVRRKI